MNKQRQSKNGLLVLISSPSGGGKNTVIKSLLKYFVHATQLVTTTTRKKRVGEQDGTDYHFINREEFETKLKNGDFVEYNEYSGSLYGTQWEDLTNAVSNHEIVLSQADVHGKKNLDKQGVPHLSIFLLPENLDVLKHRITQRGGVSNEDMQKRLEAAEHEIETSKIYDYQITNEQDNMEQTINMIKGIIKKNL
ncbi:MAG: guanylate kinase [Candidatus Magasanikbacteria bacterium CG_4_10_14_0_2_um_filter_37_12]|uniref:Guanylate kinase n=1 Tax=Candidatus Magasanikbacteria bacterium CG_4_10_14_0_2_um_filter_37_12 TaxID=1974637 RepID=A0A2M7V9V8_9BACT|nr:MAG: guanylate kinase [Candidatus Magasanikbacteria bacterium CG_4_10_14_0_2_um_filter_37_12]